MSKSAQHGELLRTRRQTRTHKPKRKRFSNWATDSYAYGRNTDPIYKTIPFYVGLLQKKAYGIFFDNSFRSHFDFCNERRNVTSFWADGGEMNYYFFYGPEMIDVIKSYTDLTGTLNYLLCGHWDTTSVNGVIIPNLKLWVSPKNSENCKYPRCDAIYLDIDYMDGFRCFTWDKNHFFQTLRKWLKIWLMTDLRLFLL